MILHTVETFKFLVLIYVSHCTNFSFVIKPSLYVLRFVNFHMFCNTCLSLLLQEALGISHVAEPTSSATQGIVFLIDKQLLYQITCFGISERDVTVSILL